MDSPTMVQSGLGRAKVSELLSETVAGGRNLVRVWLLIEEIVVLPHLGVGAHRTIARLHIWGVKEVVVKIQGQACVNRALTLEELFHFYRLLRFAEVRSIFLVRLLLCDNF
jgi:hypothetical protein